MYESSNENWNECFLEGSVERKSRGTRWKQCIHLGNAAARSKLAPRRGNISMRLCNVDSRYAGRATLVDRA